MNIEACKSAVLHGLCVLMLRPCGGGDEGSIPHLLATSALAISQVERRTVALQ